jgi:hypothetical protein
MSPRPSRIDHHIPADGHAGQVNLHPVEKRTRLASSGAIDILLFLLSFCLCCMGRHPMRCFNELINGTRSGFGSCFAEKGKPADAPFIVTPTEIWSPSQAKQPCFAASID